MLIGPANDPDRYELVERISSGGEGQLWKGSIDVDGAGVPVAVKVIHPSKAVELDEWRTRWQRQAELLRSLDHPGLVRVREVFDGPEAHEVGAADLNTNTLYLVMNWVEGPTLEEWASRNPERDVLESARVLGQLASAVDFLHAGAVTNNPVLHRDIKPANVIVGASGAVLVDFGFSRVLGGQELTFVGTPAYIAPEIVDGQEFSPAADRYSLGATGYFVLTGQTPTPENRAGMVAALTSVAGAEGRDDIAEHVLSMMDRVPENRPVSSVAWAQQLAAASISSAGQTHFGAPPPVPPGSAQMADSGGSSRKPLMLIGVAVAAVVALVAGVVVLGGGDDGDSDDAAEPPATTDVPAEDEPAESDVKSSAATSVVDATTTTTASATTTTTTTIPVIEVPRLTGATPEEAQAQLAELGLDSSISEEEGAGPYGEVVGVEPDEGTELSPGDAVTLITRRQPAAMPDIVSASQGDAKRTLESYGVTVSVTEVLDDQQADDTVVSQTPAAGEPFATEAQLTVARQPVITFLEDLEVVAGDARTGQAQVNGEIYTRNVRVPISSNGRYAEFDLARDYQRLVGVVGPEDDIPSNGLTKVEIFGDGTQLFDETLGLGEQRLLDLDVSGVLRLRLQVTRVSSDWTSNFVKYVAFADAQVQGLPGVVPSADG